MCIYNGWIQDCINAHIIDRMVRRFSATSVCLRRLLEWTSPSALLPPYQSFHIKLVCMSFSQLIFPWIWAIWSGSSRQSTISTRVRQHLADRSKIAPVSQAPSPSPMHFMLYANHTLVSILAGEKMNAKIGSHSQLPTHQ
jgi:hypothetical protein